MISQSPYFCNIRVDSANRATSWMFHGTWQVPDCSSFDGRTIAVPIRAEDTRPELNSPDWFPELVEDVARAKRWNILWYGGKVGPPANIQLKENDEYLAYEEKTLLDQIRELRQRSRAAVGWNSGGLDIAGAAGLPLLRIGEYQKHGPDQKWGSKYNSYLATATAIGLAPVHMNAAQFSKARLYESLITFLDRIDNLKKARHAILPPDVALSATTFEEDLDKHEVPWPECGEKTE